MTAGIILAAGRGSRINSNGTNKTALSVAGKPLVVFGAELFHQTLDKTLVVVGAFGESVQAALQDFEVSYAWQSEQKGTGHAARVAVEEIERLNWRPEVVCLGYGDHMMFYTPEIVRGLLAERARAQAALALVTTTHPDPHSLAWGRIIRNEQGEVVSIVEQKDATPEQLRIQELNAGFYCFDYAFLRDALAQIQPSAVTGEYYLTDVIAVAQQQGRKVIPYSAPFANVGTGINTADQLQKTQELLA